MFAFARAALARRASSSSAWWQLGKSPSNYETLAPRFGVLLISTTRNIALDDDERILLAHRGGAAPSSRLSRFAAPLA